MGPADTSSSLFSSLDLSRDSFTATPEDEDDEDSNNNNVEEKETGDEVSLSTTAVEDNSFPSQDFSSQLRLASLLAVCRQQLSEKESKLSQLRGQREEQLAQLCVQIMSLEVGLRRRERELKGALQQRERIIREQAAVIRFLMRKNGRKTISGIKDQALAKIPQIVDDGEDNQEDRRDEEEEEEDKDFVKESNNVTTIRVTGADLSTRRRRRKSGCLSRVSENDDSDSAILLDDDNVSSSVSSPSSCFGGQLSKGISRSVSDVVSAVNNSATSSSSSSGVSDTLGSNASCSLSDTEADEELLRDPFGAQYKSFLLRRGSYERFKGGNRSGGGKVKKSSNVKSKKEPSLASGPESLASLDSLKLFNERNGAHVHGVDSPTSSKTQNPNHRSVMKPRDVKNRSSSKARQHSKTVTICAPEVAEALAANSSRAEMAEAAESSSSRSVYSSPFFVENEHA